jgi:TonB family protein
MTRTMPVSTLVSLLAHAAAVFLLLAASSHLAPSHGATHERATRLFTPMPVLKAEPGRAIGGGGGERAKTPASAGHLPKITARQFVAPTMHPVNDHPKLAMDPSIEAPPEIAALDRALPNLGDPLSGASVLSGGQGGPLGIGDGRGTGIGKKSRPGAGNGDDPDGNVFVAGRDGVTAPVLIRGIEPEFSDEARRAKYEGTVVIRADVDAFGRARNIRIVHSLGMGLDEKAMEAVTQWLFRPGTRNGKPVTVSALIQLTFHLL